jgi:hypothetical protein
MDRVLYQVAEIVERLRCIALSMSPRAGARHLPNEASAASVEHARIKLTNAGWSVTHSSPDDASCG